MSIGVHSRERTRVLFVVHSASRNGASILLLEFIRWLRTQVDWDIRVMVNGTGPLLDDFRAVAPTTVCRSPTTLLDTLIGTAKRGARRTMDNVLLHLGLPRGRFDLIYVNTSAMASALPLLAKRADAVLWHIHELDYALLSTLSGETAQVALRVATRFVAVSRQVHRTLVHHYSVPHDKIDVAHGFIRPVAAARDRSGKRTAVLSRLQWPDDALVIGACGVPEWRKGSDLFLQAARALVFDLGAAKARFLWVGGDSEGRQALEFDCEVRKLGLDAVCKRVASTSEVADYFCAFDVFALTSREDPFPLVMLEAADHALPIVCFESTGGSNEFVAGGAGIMVRYGDCAAFAAQLAELSGSSQLRARLGREAQRRLLNAHVVETQGPQLLHSMRACLNGSQPLKVSKGIAVPDSDATGLKNRT